MQDQQRPELFSDLPIDHVARQYIRSAASWAMISVVVAVVGYAISVVQILFKKPPRMNTQEGFDFVYISSGSEIGLALFSIVAGLVFNFFLYRFATQARQAADQLDQQQMAASFRHLRIYFMAATIVLIVIFAVILLAVMVLLIGGTPAGK